METSDTISELITALAAAQGEFKAVPKNRTNPAVNSKYATLDGVIATIREPLSKNGLAFVQPLTTAEGACWLETRIMHSSGEWMATAAEVPDWAGNRAVNSLQSFGGALTYMRRYMLTSMLGINAEEDTDGSGGSGNGKKPKREAQRKIKPKPQPKSADDTGHGFSLSEIAMKTILEQGLAANAHNAAAMVNLSSILNKDSTDADILNWACIYRGARETMDSEAAAKQADAQLALEVNAPAEEA